MAQISIYNFTSLLLSYGFMSPGKIPLLLCSSHLSTQSTGHREEKVLKKTLHGAKSSPFTLTHLW